MNKYFLRMLALIVAGLAAGAFPVTAENASHGSGASRDTLDVVNYRYYFLDSWAGAIGLPDDPFKSVVESDGTFWSERGKTSLRQGIYPLALYQSPIRIHSTLEGAIERVDQRMYSPRVPISIAHKRQGDIAIEETLFLAGPFDWSSAVMSEDLKGRNSLPQPRRYLLITEYTNNGVKPIEITPVLDVEGPAPMPNLDDNTIFELGPTTFCRTTLPIDGFQQWEASKTMYKPALHLKKLVIPPGQKMRWVLTINRNGFDNSRAVEWHEADELRKQAITYWEKSAGLPYDVIQVPDPEIQAILDTSIRELYQMRYIINDLPAFYLGPSGYNDYWVFDGSLVTEAADLLGRSKDASGYNDYLLLHQHADGRIQALTMHWKETGIAIMTLYRHAQMIQDKDWLRQRWPQFRHAVAAIEKFRRLGSSADPGALNYRLSPEGFGDGGIMITADYTNNHWLLAGMKAAVEAARWLGEISDFEAWEKEYRDFDVSFQKAIARDAKTDAHGNRYIPAVMGPGSPNHPTRGQWAFLLGVYPGRIFAQDDPLMLGTLKMLESNGAAEEGGMIEDCGWSSFWTACSSFFARDQLWLGNGRKASRMLYTIANHASPVWNVCEETPKRSKPEEIISSAKGCSGDMPDIFNAVEFIRMTAQLLAFDRGQDLHLFEGLPPEWLKAGMITRLNGMGTPFGQLTLELKIAADGKRAMLKVAPLSDPNCHKIVVHLGGWVSQDEKAVQELTPNENHQLEFSLMN